MTPSRLLAVAALLVCGLLSAAPASAQKGMPGPGPKLPPVGPPQPGMHPHHRFFHHRPTVLLAPAFFPGYAYPGFLWTAYSPAGFPYPAFAPPGYFDPGYGGPSGQVNISLKPAPRPKQEEPPSLPVVKKTGRIQIFLPDPQAEVLFNGQKTNSSGAVRLFETPDLQASKVTTYQVTVRWTHNGKTLTREATVTVAPGQLSLVDFSRPPAKQ
jgi:uncharacterized protein (TIGR03000 family)